MRTNEKDIKLVECPRDAMQGWKNFIPTNKKIAYINQLLKVGFDTIDFGSFVSPKAIPQMADTKEVIEGLSIHTPTKLLAIVANVRGAKEAAAFNEISYIGFPFSVSETFQLRNTNSTIEQSFEQVKDIQNICLAADKELVIYISMAFGNPYNDAYDANVVLHWIDTLIKENIGIISLADTVGVATPAQVSALTKKVADAFPGIETGVHLHSKKTHWQQKVDAALQQGCRKFDGALKGIGGCPMAGDELVGNMNSELMIPYFKTLGYCKNINEEELLKSIAMASQIFG